MLRSAHGRPPQEKERNVIRSDMTSTLAIFALALAACGSGRGTPPAAAASPESTPASPTASAAPTPAEQPSVAGWRSWPQTNDARFVSRGHKGKWVDVYVNPVGESEYRAANGPYAVGATIVKVHYANETSQEIIKLAVMRKMDAGYDPDHGDWYYGVYGADGTEPKMSGKIGKCISCHERAADRDYAFGLAR